MRQAQYSAQVSAADLESQRLLEQATLAQTYFEIRGQDALQELLDSTVEADARVLEATQALYATGIGTDVAVALAEQTVLTVRAQATNAGDLARPVRTRHRYAARRPGHHIHHPQARLARLASSDRPAPLHSSSSGARISPAAERQMAAANALIGVGYAAYYPTLTLSASAGFSSSALQTLFSWPSHVWSLGAGLSETLLDGGLRKATIDQYVATYNANVAGYRQTVLTAFQQVEDSLSQTRILAAEVEQQKQVVALRATGVRARAGALRHRPGSISDSDDPAGPLLSARQTLVSLQVQGMTSTVLLVQALGGGWNKSDLPTPSAVSQDPSSTERAAQ